MSVALLRNLKKVHTPEGILVSSLLGMMNGKSFFWRAI
jgi:hypothetical protein